jgi:Periplasmic binding protein
MKRFLARLIVALTAAFGASVGHAEIQIGVATPLTGPRAWAGEQVRAGADLAVRDLNEHGGVLGEPLAAVLVDDSVIRIRRSPLRTSSLPTVCRSSSAISALAPPFRLRQSTKTQASS